MKVGEERRKGVEVEVVVIVVFVVVVVVVRVIVGGVEVSTGFLKGNIRGVIGIFIIMKNGLIYKGTIESFRRYWKS